MNELFIGVDIGYGNTKSMNHVFASGIKELFVKPPLEKKCVKYKDKYYIVGNPKMEIPKSKTENEHTRILTMAIIAEELKGRRLTEADIRLGIGLPLTKMGSEKNDYEKYMLAEPNLEFEYEDKLYKVHIKSVDVFPQGYAGYLEKIKDIKKSAVIVDIGSWTVDILPIKDGKPDIARCKSLPLGTITCMNEINENLRQLFDGEADEGTIKEVMIKGKSDINNNYLTVIKEGISAYVDSIMNNLRGLKFNKDINQFVFIGGGAAIIDHFYADKDSVTIFSDICINAKGYAHLIETKYKAGA